jgi:hypothetical protein
MTSKIKVDNIENQCGGAVVTKCGATTTISGSVVKADDIQAADGGNLINQCGTTITLGASGDTIELASGASQTGFGRTGTVDWDTTPKTATFSAVSGNGYFCNTTSSAFTVNLPAGSAGAIVSLADYAATWQTNNLTVSPNGSEKIGSVNADATLSTEGQSVTFVYVDSTQGWVNVQDSTSNVRPSPFLVATGGTITECGDCKIHTFTGPGTFCVSVIGTVALNNQVSYLVVAGGGGGGAIRGGGAGAGGFREDKSPITPYTASPLEGAGPITATVSAYPITVGAGGTFGSASTNGANSVFSTITSAGGGNGGSREGPQPPGGPGGSGGGGGGDGAAGNPRGTGNTPPTSPAQGTNGGCGAVRTGGGGGGATVAGTPNSGPAGNGGPGGNGATTSISGSPTTYAGGGGGGTESGSRGTGGTGGGGRGGQFPNSAPGYQESGTANTGGGGGGGGDYTAPGAYGNGGSGIVIIRYKFQ